MIVAIFLGSMKIPYTEIRRQILEVNEDVLSCHMIERLLQYIPSPDQLSKLSALSREYESLTEAEQFAVVVGKPFKNMQLIKC